VSTRELATATRLARAAGVVLLRHRRQGLAIRSKAGGEIVTSGDLESDRLIRDGLAEAFPEDALCTEETADSPGRLAAKRVWIVDPLDSTSAYANGGDQFAVSVGLAVDGEPVLGVVYNPARGELIAGGRGLGVTLNRRPVHVSTADSLASARLIVSPKEWRQGLDGLPATPIASMAYKLARVAAGLDDGVFSIKARKAWGSCAGVALVLAAGGSATQLDGSPVHFNRPLDCHARGLVAAGPRLHPALLAHLSGVPG
jgi:myo-inositol-1(or 4)-monophosphatase